MRKPDRTQQASKQADHPARPPRERPKMAAPDAARLHAAALNHLARFAATQAGLTAVLQRKVDRWARQAEADEEATARTVQAARAAIPGIVARLAGSGAVSDEAFASARARSLARAGRSRRAIGAHLAGKGVPGALAAAALPDDPEHELAGALIHARKRRMGPWRRKPPEPETARREMASFARAGYAHGVAAQALRMDQESGEQIIIRFRATL